jgi:hypothetical protein
MDEFLRGWPAESALYHLQSLRRPGWPAPWGNMQVVKDLEEVWRFPEQNPVSVIELTIQE